MLETPVVEASEDQQAPLDQAASPEPTTEKDPLAWESLSAQDKTLGGFIKKLEVTKPEIAASIKAAVVKINEGRIGPRVGQTNNLSDSLGLSFNLLVSLRDAILDRSQNPRYNGEDVLLLEKYMQKVPKPNFR